MMYGFTVVGLFQFLSRNSVRWDHIDRGHSIPVADVSIPQSEFCPLGRWEQAPGGALGARFQFLSRNSVRWDAARADDRAHRVGVSIPQSEFCPLGRGSPAGPIAAQSGFNSSVGILSVGTSGRSSPARATMDRFNSSVGILSVGTREALYPGNLIQSDVSIPQSEFCPLGLR